MKRVIPTILALWLPLSAVAETITLAPVQLTDWKAVFGRIEARDRLPARARLGGTLVELAVKEGDEVKAGAVLGRIVDEKLAFQLSAIDARKTALEAQLSNAEAELKRGEDLLSRGVTTVQRLDALRTQVDVLKGQIEAVTAERQVVQQQSDEGAVLAPADGRVLDVPVAMGAVVMPGEVVAVLGGGGIFLRLAVPERHAAALSEGDMLPIEGPEGETQGKLERVYPLIENGRVVADVAVQGLSDRFVDARVLVRLPMGTREALAVPQGALITRGGVDFVAVETAGGLMLRTVIPGEAHQINGVVLVETLSGLQPGDKVRSDGAAAATELTVAPEGAGHE